MLKKKKKRGGSEKWKIVLKQTIKNYFEYKGAMKGIISYPPKTESLNQASRSAWESRVLIFSLYKLESTPSEFLGS